MVDKKVLVNTLEILMVALLREELDFHETIKNLKEEIQDGKYDVKLWEYHD